MGTLPLLQRLKEIFDNVVVMNYHNEHVKGPDESFFCHALPSATQTCNAIVTDDTSVLRNERINLDHSDLAYGATKAGLIKIESDKKMNEVAKALQSHQEKTLKLKSSDFKRQCLPPDILQELWELSLGFELTLFPEYVNSTANDLRSDFEEAAKTTLCKIDIEKTLKEEKWQSFFNSYE